MKAPPLPSNVAFRPTFTSGRLNDYSALLFGSGNQGAGGRALVSSDGKILLRGNVPLPFNVVFPATAHRAGDVRLTRARQDTPLYGDPNKPIITGWAKGETTEKPGGTLVPDATTSLNTEGQNNLIFTAKQYNAYGYYPKTEQEKLWQWLTAYTEQINGLEPIVIDPASITSCLAGEVQATLKATGNVSTSAVATWPEPGQYNLELEATCSVVSACGALLFGYFGRRGAVCDFPIRLTGNIENANATLRIYQAEGEPTEYLTEEDVAGAMPKWRQIGEHTLTEDDNYALSDARPLEESKIITCPIPGSTLMLATLSCEGIKETVREDKYYNHWYRYTDKDGNATVALELLPPLSAPQKKGNP